ARTVRCGGSLRALRANGTCNARAAAARGARLAPGTVNDLGNLVVMQGLALIDSSFMADRGFTPREALARARRRRDVLEGMRSSPPCFTACPAALETRRPSSSGARPARSRRWAARVPHPAAGR